MQLFIYSFIIYALFQELGNQLEKTKNNERLQEILTNAVIMVVSVSASTTQGVELSENELATVVEACDMVRTKETLYTNRRGISPCQNKASHIWSFSFTYKM